MHTRFYSRLGGVHVDVTPVTAEIDSGFGLLPLIGNQQKDKCEAEKKEIEYRRLIKKQLCKTPYHISGPYNDVTISHP